MCRVTVTNIYNFCYPLTLQAEMERALLQGEVSVQQDKILQDDRQLDQLRFKDERLAKELEYFRHQEGAKISATKSKMEEIECELNR